MTLNEMIEHFKETPWNEITYWMKPFRFFRCVMKLKN